MNGILVVDKPAGPTSHDVVARVRGVLGFERIGHTGTLDPLATGVLPLVVGRATRLARFFAASPKTYLATLLLGRATATYDVDGETLSGVREAPDRVTRPDVEHALEAFRGTYWQTPPPFSARKVDGTRAYNLARRRLPVEPRPAEVSVEQIDLIAFDSPRVTLRVRCSPGFYVRSLAHDLGRRLGCGACLETLRREESCGFHLADATALALLEREGHEAARRIVPMARLLPQLPGLVLTEAGSHRAAHGNTLAPDDVDLAVSPSADYVGAAEDRPVRLLDRDGNIVAIGEVRPGGFLHPRIVLV